MTLVFSFRGAGGRDMLRRVAPPKRVVAIQVQVPELAGIAWRPRPPVGTPLVLRRPYGSNLFEMDLEERNYPLFSVERVDLQIKRVERV